MAALEQLASERGLPRDKLRSLLALPSEPASMHAMLPDGETELVEMIEDKTTPSPLGALVDVRMRELVAAMLKTMSPTEADVLRRRFGIGGGALGTYDEIARQVGVSREYIRHIERRALKALRDSAQARRALEANWK